MKDSPGAAAFRCDSSGSSAVSAFCGVFVFLFFRREMSAEAVDLVAQVQQHFTDGRADAGGGTGDDGDFSFLIHEILLLSCRILHGRSDIGVPVRCLLPLSLLNGKNLLRRNFRQAVSEKLFHFPGESRRILVNLALIFVGILNNGRVRHGPPHGF